MSNQSKYPRFVWIAGLVIILIIVGYVIYTGQQVEEIEFPVGKKRQLKQKSIITLPVRREGQKMPFSP